MNMLSLFSFKKHNAKKAAENQKTAADNWGYELYKSLEYKGAGSQDESKSSHRDMDYFIIR